MWELDFGVLSHFVAHFHTCVDCCNGVMKTTTWLKVKSCCWILEDFDRWDVWRFNRLTEVIIGYNRSFDDRTLIDIVLMLWSVEGLSLLYSIASPLRCTLACIIWSRRNVILTSTIGLMTQNLFDTRGNFLHEAFFRYMGCIPLCPGAFWNVIILTKSMTLL